MARFLWLTWPRRARSTEESAKGLWLPWLGLVAAMLGGVWLLPGALEVLPDKLTPAKLWDALWPLLVGGGLAGLGPWLRRRFAGDLTRCLPAGDVGVALERLLKRVSLRWPAGEAAPHAYTHDEPAAADASAWSARLAGLGGRLGRVEQVLASPQVGGALLLLLIGLLVWMLAASGG
jgi:hypothetical protein